MLLGKLLKKPVMPPRVSIMPLSRVRNSSKRVKMAIRRPRKRLRTSRRRLKLSWKRPKILLRRQSKRLRRLNPPSKQEIQLSRKQRLPPRRLPQQPKMSIRPSNREARKTLASPSPSLTRRTMIRRRTVSRRRRKRSSAKRRRKRRGKRRNRRRGNWNSKRESSS
jgi:hypothetical protein